MSAHTYNFLSSVPLLPLNLCNRPVTISNSALCQIMYDREKSATNFSITSTETESICITRRPVNFSHATSNMYIHVSSLFCIIQKSLKCQGRFARVKWPLKSILKRLTIYFLCPVINRVCLVFMRLRLYTNKANQI